MRLFVAIELSKEIKRELNRVAGSLADFNRMVRWTKDDQMHLTLKFLGEVNDNQADSICKAVESATVESNAFDIELSGAGCFPPRGRARIVWVGLHEPTGALNCCQKAVETELDKIGFPPEDRPFSPHLTIGRVREDRSNGKLHQAVEKANVSTIVQPVKSIVLMQSELLPQGAKYSKVGTWSLKEK